MGADQQFVALNPNWLSPKGNLPQTFQHVHKTSLCISFCICYLQGSGSHTKLHLYSPLLQSHSSKQKTRMALYQYNNSITMSFPLNPVPSLSGITQNFFPLTELFRLKRDLFSASVYSDFVGSHTEAREIHSVHRTEAEYLSL